MRNTKKKFEKIYDKHINKIYRFVFLKVSSKEIAEDLTSQVFAKGWRVFKKTDSKIKNPNAYLYQIARTEIANYYRDRAKIRIVTAETGDIQDQQQGVEDVHQARSDVGNLMENLKQLSLEEQDVIVWRYLDKMSTKEISNILDKSEGAVRVMLHRALKALRNKMNL